MLSRMKHSEIIQPINKPVSANEFLLNECVCAILWLSDLQRSEIIFTPVYCANTVKDEDKQLWTTVRKPVGKKQERQVAESNSDNKAALQCF